LRSDDGRLKIVDFGIARTLSPVPDTQAGLTMAGTRLGTPGYMAPEQLRGQPVDARVDIFAFGVMAYELATGSHPFGGSDPAALLERLLSDDPPLSRPIEPPGLDAIIRTCLKGNPDGRYASGAELVQSLRSLQTGPAAAVQYVPAPRTAGWWKFHQVAVAFLTSGAVVTVGVRRQWIGDYGSAVFLAVLVLATISTTLRLHLWFVSHFQPALLGALRARVLRWVVVIEALLVTIFMGIGIRFSGQCSSSRASFRKKVDPVVKRRTMVTSLRKPRARSEKWIPFSIRCRSRIRALTTPRALAKSVDLTL